MEFANQVCCRENGKALILAPLAVSKQTKKEGEKFGIEVNICRTQEDVKDGINITNYEMINHFNPSEFVCVVLDESSILKATLGKMSNQIIDMFRTNKTIINLEIFQKLEIGRKCFEGFCPIF